ncbi:4-hydroxy-tetrahydrodipicolinate synthase [Halanaerobium salsuginis]|jgi:4-hydroxy-tetrahydrodipicolinate synthase|uniref:4-hydroxy-tetrahydrodipicolinate synthase n=1 Tax=Halanaerobium salsuginis TaxID=29563 RepID=A0A1I4IIB9_9FIRM|nr:4-hydroxy-tetrahydrodipicolinate synthase [Halanaerobium salsuginis]SFL53753.1 4-hydroxy-tetrahydrodipicolinate synthase [Halanaerobium salsuginis]
MKFEAKGIIPAMLTPLDEYGDIDENILKKLTNFLIESGVHGLFAVSSTGECYGLDFEQKKKILKIVLAENRGRVPVYAGTGLITTRDTIKMTRLAAELGVNAVSVITPMFIHPNNEELYDHFKAVARSVDLPVLLYNNPARTGVNIEVDLLVKLSKIDNIVGIKDSSGDMTLVSEFIRKTEPDFNVLIGKDTLILSGLVYGAKGTIASTGNLVPKLLVEIYDEYQKGNLAAAKKAQFKLSQLRMSYDLGSFPVILKDGLNILGLNAGNTLAPIKNLAVEKKEKLKLVLKEIGAL